MLLSHAYCTCERNTVEFCYVTHTVHVNGIQWRSVVTHTVHAKGIQWSSVKSRILYLQKEYSGMLLSLAYCTCERNTVEFF